MLTTADLEKRIEKLKERYQQTAQEKEGESPAEKIRKIRKRIKRTQRKLRKMKALEAKNKVPAKEESKKEDEPKKQEGTADAPKPDESE